MEAMLKATEVAQLMGCSKEYVTRMAREGRLEHEKTLNERNRPMLLFPVSGLEPQLQQKYYAQLKTNLPEVRLPDGAGPKHKTPKAFDQYTADEREEIAWWLKTVDEWQTYRAKYPGKKAEADEKFIALCAKIDPEHEFSIDILYLYKIGTTTPVLTIKNVTSYTDNSVEGEGSPDLDGEPSGHCTYSPLAEGYELSSKPDCSETLRAAYREAHPSPEVWREEMEAMMAIALYGGGDEA